jgi:hypothetical protein
MFKKVMNVTIVMAVSFALLVVISTIIQDSTAQDGTIPLPDGTTTPVSISIADYKVFGDPANYQIVYFVGETAYAENDITSPTGMFGQISKADIATTWAEVEQLDAITPIEAIIIHKLAYEAVDKSWTAAAARRGVTIAVINMYAAEQAELRDSNCDRQKSIEDPFASESGSYFLLAVHLIYAENPADSDLDRAIQESYENCKYTATKNGIYEYTKSTQMRLTDEDSVEFFVNGLINAIDGVKRFKESVSNPQLIPTPLEVLPEVSN